MTATLPDIGKISPEVFQHLILPHLGARDARVLVPPQNGVDVGVIAIGGGQVMAVTTDPVFIVPAYGWERAAWFALHILASDAATSGLKPTYLTIDLNLPLAIEMDGLNAIWTTIHRECERLGIAIVAGHTARYDGCDFPMVGGATVMSVGPEDSYVVPTMAQVGDAVIVTKGAAIEATGLFGVSFPALVAEKCGAAMAQGAADLFWQMSVVEDAMTAVSVGVRDNGVTAMHDATECGVWGGLYEIAQAANVGMRIDRAAIPVAEAARAVCDAFAMDPYAAISEGTLLLTCRPEKADAVVRALAAKGIVGSIVGEALPADRGTTVTENGTDRPLVHPRVDPFWNAFGQAMAQVTGQ
jgi:hydrogenase expression/formation protein HypE